MNSLLLDLKPLRFDALMELARAVIPPNAPAWTDHNVHDPGIMLAELIAWVADAQGYAVARIRKDERAAYARLVGLAPRGSTPARGLLWPDSDSRAPAPWPRGTIVGHDTAISGDTEDSPALRVSDAVLLVTATLVAVRSDLGDGCTRDWTRLNQEGATFWPFGCPLEAKARLVLEFDGGLADAQVPGEPRLSLGFEIVAPGPTLACRDGEPSSPRGPRRRLTVELVDTHGRRPLRIVRDTTGGLMRSGVLLLALPEPAPMSARWSIEISAPAGALLAAPAVRQLAPNVLPVVQQEAVDEWAADPLNGAPDMTYRLQRGALVSDDDAHAVAVSIDNEEWTEAQDLASQAPGDACYVLDRNDGVLRFGNGVNGRIPGKGGALRVRYSVTDGAHGNVARPGRWNVRGVLGSFRNTEPLAGGADVQTLADLRRIARRETAVARPIVTRDDLAAAALELCDLRVARAYEPALDAVRGHAVRGLRTLVVVAAAVDGERVTETPQWLDAVRARLATRLPLGQRLHVRAPHYVRVGVKARLVAQRLVRPEDVAEAAAARLRDALGLVAAKPGDREWPFGRDVATLTVQGWLRRVPGVAHIDAVTLLADGRAVDGPAVSLGAIGLPLAEVAATDIEVARSGTAQGTT